MQKNSQSFDLFRLTKSKEQVDVHPNTIRKYHKCGLQFYKVGRAVFVSKSELDAFIRSANSRPEMSHMPDGYKEMKNNS
jgi:hypothetical protein